MCIWWRIALVLLGDWCFWRHKNGVRIISVMASGGTGTMFFFVVGGLFWRVGRRGRAMICVGWLWLLFVWLGKAETGRRHLTVVRAETWETRGGATRACQDCVALECGILERKKRQTKCYWEENYHLFRLLLGVLFFIWFVVDRPATRVWCHIIPIDLYYTLSKVFVLHHRHTSHRLCKHTSSRDHTPTQWMNETCSMKLKPASIIFFLYQKYPIFIIVNFI